MFPPRGDEKTPIGLVTPVVFFFYLQPLEKKCSLSTQVGAPGPAAWASPVPTGAGNCSGPTTAMDITITTEPNQVMGLFACLTGCRRASEGTRCLSPDLAPCALLQEMRLKMDEDLEKREIETMPVVRSLRLHTAQKKNKAGYRANLRCACGVQQVGPFRMSSKYPRLVDCLRGLGQQIQRDHGPTCIAAAQK